MIETYNQRIKELEESKEGKDFMDTENIETLIFEYEQKIEKAKVLFLAELLNAYQVVAEDAVGVE